MSAASIAVWMPVLLAGGIPGVLYTLTLLAKNDSVGLFRVKERLLLAARRGDGRAVAREHRGLWQWGYKNRCARSDCWLAGVYVGCGNRQRGMGHALWRVEELGQDGKSIDGRRRVLFDDRHRHSWQSRSLEIFAHCLYIPAAANVALHSGKAKFPLD